MAFVKVYINFLITIVINTVAIALGHIKVPYTWDLFVLLNTSITYWWFSFWHGYCMCYLK